MVPLAYENLCIKCFSLFFYFFLTLDCMENSCLPKIDAKSLKSTPK